MTHDKTKFVRRFVEEMNATQTVSIPDYNDCVLGHDFASIHGDEIKSQNIYLKIVCMESKKTIYRQFFCNKDVDGYTICLSYRSLKELDIRPKELKSTPQVVLVKSVPFWKYKLHQSNMAERFTFIFGILGCAGFILTLIQLICSVNNG